MTGRILHGADEVVRGAFWDLGQIDGTNGPKYSEAVRRRLAAKILDGRAHERLVFRLCHLARAASCAVDQRHMGWLEFFSAGGAGRADWASGWFRARLAEEGPGSAGLPATAGVAGVSLRYLSRAEPMTISFGAMPLLAAFMEFLLNALPIAALRDDMASLSRVDLGWRELQDTANALSRSVYAWLREHTRPVQDSRQFDVMTRFLAGRGADGDFAVEDIDDAAVLAFWRAASLEPDTEFRTFRKTFRTFLHLVEALREEGWREGIDDPEALDGAAERAGREPADPSSPGLDRMRAPQPVAEVWGASAEEEEPSSPLEVLASSEIRLLLESEMKRLILVNAHGPVLPPLARSLLRDACFGHVQGRISQALRAGSAAAVAALTAAPPETGYDQEAAVLASLLARLDDLMLATAAALAEDVGESVRRGAAGASTAPAAAPLVASAASRSTAPAALARGAREKVRHEASNASAASPSAARAPRAGDAGESARRLDFETAGRGRRVLKGLRRRGFDRVRAREPAALDDLRRVIPAMVELRRRLAPVCARLQEGAPWGARQQEDERAFAEQFARIYGVADAREDADAREEGAAS